MSLSETQFHALIDALQLQIEDRFDASGLDVDLENSGGVLTVRFDNDSQLIFSRQPVLRQLWIAARSGGFHCDYLDEQGWYCASTGESLTELLNRTVAEQSGQMLDFGDLRYT